MKRDTKRIVEKEVLDKLSCSDFSTFRDVYKSLYIPLYNYANRFVSDTEVAKDIVQETFLTLWENRTEIKSVKNLKNYLFKSIKNRCLNYFKHLQVEDNHQDNAYYWLKGIELAAPDRYNNVFEYLDNEDLKSRVSKILDGLPEERKKIFMLSRFHGLKNQEIADKLNISVRTVDTQIYRAMKVFKEQLKDIIK